MPIPPHPPAATSAQVLRRRLGVVCIALAQSFAGCAGPRDPRPAAAAPDAAAPGDGAGDAAGGRTKNKDAAGAAPSLPAVRPMRLGPDVSTDALLSAAKAAFAQRTDQAQLKFAIAQWERAHGLEPDNADIALMLSRAYFLLGDSFLRPAADASPGVMHDAFERGVLAGEQALMLLSPSFAQKLNEGRPVEEALTATDARGLEALTYYAQNLTAFAIARGIPTMLLYRKRVQTLVEQIIARDEAYNFGVAYRIRGTFLASAPSFAGGSLPLAQQAFVRARLLAPTYLPNALALAESWAVQAADKSAFVQTLSFVTQADPSRPAEVAAEQTLAQQRAAWLLTRVNRLF